MPHTCQAIVLSCIDFRFNQQMIEELKKRGIDKFDLKCDAGGVKYLISEDKPGVRDWILENIDTAKRLHKIEKIVLINHYDCGAYGGNSTWESDESQTKFQSDELAQAKSMLSQKYPDLSIETILARLENGKVYLQST